MRKGSSGKVAVLILSLLVYSMAALSSRAAEPQPVPWSPYPHQFLTGTVGASIGFLGGGTLGTVAVILGQGQLDQLSEAERRSAAWTILIAGGIGAVTGATWGVAYAGMRQGYPGNVPLALVGATLAEVAWFQLTLARQDILEARYSLWPGLGIVVSGLVLPVVGALVGYHL